eukprot:363544-Chlamydomonas_euryale.AAC.14
MKCADTRLCKWRVSMLLSRAKVCTVALFGRDVTQPLGVRLFTGLESQSRGNIARARVHAQRGQVSNRILTVGSVSRAEMLSKLLQPLAPGMTQPLSVLSSRGFLTATGVFKTTAGILCAANLPMARPLCAALRKRACIHLPATSSRQALCTARRVSTQQVPGVPWVSRSYQGCSNQGCSERCWRTVDPHTHPLPAHEERLRLVAPCCLVVLSEEQPAASRNPHGQRRWRARVLRRRFVQWRPSQHRVPSDGHCQHGLYGEGVPRRDGWHYGRRAAGHVRRAAAAGEAGRPAGGVCGSDLCQVWMRRAGGLARGEVAGTVAAKAHLSHSDARSYGKEAPHPVLHDALVVSWQALRRPHAAAPEAPPRLSPSLPRPPHARLTCLSAPPPWPPQARPRCVDAERRHAAVRHVVAGAAGR